MTKKEKNNVNKPQDETNDETTSEQTSDEQTPDSETDTQDSEKPSEDSENANDADEKDKEPSPEEILKAEKDKYVRLYAEYENFRKRSQKEREGLYEVVKSETVAKFLPVYDNIERALKQKTEDEAFYKGIEMTMTQLNEVFDKLGVKPIEAVGKKFDAKLHEAVMHVEDDEHGENEIVEEFRKGFTIGGKVIRFSMVKVAN